MRKSILTILLPMLMAVGSIYAANDNCYTNLNNLSPITATKINIKNANHCFSIDYNFADSTNKKNLTASDSLKLDSNYLPRNSSAIKSKVKYKAKDSIVYSAAEKVATLYNSSNILYEDLDIKSARIKINLAKNSVNAVGEDDSLGNKINTPVFKQADAEYKIEEVTFNYETKRGYMKEFKTQEGDGFIKGNKVKRDENNNFFIKDSYYTTCSAEHPHFYIAANKLKVIPGKQVITGPANIVIEGVRTPLFIPFGIFPLKRGQQSGIIIPSYGNAKGRGFFLRQGGYYLGLGNHMDVAVLGDIYANLAWQLGTRINYSYRYRFNGYFNANYAVNKDGLPEDKNYTKSVTFRVQWTHTTDPKARPGTSFGANVDLVGNQFLALNTYSNATAFNNNINSSISYGKSFKKGKYNLSSNARASQNTQTHDMTITLPDLTLTAASFQPFKPKWKPTADKWYEKISVNYTGMFQNIIKTKDTILFKQHDSWKAYTDSVMINGFRHNASASNSFNLFKFYTLSVGADYGETWTFKTTQKDWDSTQKKVITSKVDGFSRAYQYSFRGGITTRFYGLKTFKRGRLTAIRHVVNPDIGFSYVPDFSGAAYGYYKKVQTDSIGNKVDYSIYEGTLYGGPGRGRQGNIGFGIDNNLEIKWKKGKDTAERVEKIKIFESLRASGSYNIFADSLKLSNISLSARTNLLKTISINGGATLDPYVNQKVVVNGYTSFVRVNKFYFNEQQKLGLLTNANIGLSASLNPEMFKKKNQEKHDALKKEMASKGFSEVKIPWNLSLNYTINYDYFRKIQSPKDAFVQTLTFNGSVQPTKNWFINFNSGYDFRLNKISYLGLDLRRDLHCWQFTFNWTPLSNYGVQYFIFNIQVKAGALQDLKIPKRKDWFDNRRI